VIVPGSDTPAPGLAPVSIAELLGRFEIVAPPVASARAAVTIILRDGSREVETLLIERTERAQDPASGQVALPGGHVEERDGSLAVTALRELGEEVGLGETDLAGPLRYVETRHAQRFSMDVAVFAAPLAPRGIAPRPWSHEEVATVFWLPRSTLGRTVRVHRDTALGLLEVPATVFEGHVLWGFTRRVLRDFYGLPPEDPATGPVFAKPPSVDPPTGGSASLPP
jgi:8-oxo-dGTP diphosphatase